MILIDKDIKRLLGTRLFIDPAPEDSKMQPASVDVRLGNYFARRLAARHTIDSRAPSATREKNLTRFQVSDDEALTMQPHEFILGSTKESVCVPPDIVARVEGRSSFGRLGLLVHATAGFVDPGFRGAITLEMYNLNSVPLILYPGDSIAQLVFYQASGAAERPYGHPGTRNHYQDQPEYPVASRAGDKK